MSEDIKKFTLATSDFGKEIQGELELYVTNNRLNKSSFRKRLVSISKNIRNKNLTELLFKDVKLFEAQNPVMYHQHPSRHCLGNSWEIFFQTDHLLIKIRQTWEQIRHRQ